MSPQLGMAEMLLLAAVALAVLGPRDLMLSLRRLGQWIGQIRAMAHEFTSQIEEFGLETEADSDIKKNKQTTDAKAETSSPTDENSPQ